MMIETEAGVMYFEDGGMGQKPRNTGSSLLEAD